MITGYPKDNKGNEAILVIVDSFSKYRVFVPCKMTTNTKQLLELFLERWWKHFRFPTKTVLDRGTVFNNKFLRELYKRLGIEPHFSSAYHPESDGQTERVNPFIEHFLQVYMSTEQDRWSKWLPMAQFAYNNAMHSSTRMAPFQCLYGQLPLSNPSNVEVDTPEANSTADAWSQRIKEAHSTLKLSKERMALSRPKSETPVFEIGEKVWLNARNIWLKTKAAKLDNRRLGPYPIKTCISDWVYELELLETLKVHPVFYIGLFSKVTEAEHRPFTECPLPETIDGEEEYKVKAILE